MSNDFERHKYNYTIPTDKIGRLTKRVAEQEAEIARLTALLDAVTEQYEEMRYEAARNNVDSETWDDLEKILAIGEPDAQS